MKMLLRLFVFILLSASGCVGLRGWIEDNNLYHGICRPVCPQDWMVFYDGKETCGCMSPEPGGDMFQTPAPLSSKRKNRLTVVQKKQKKEAVMQEP